MMLFYLIMCYLALGERPNMWLWKRLSFGHLPKACLCQDHAIEQAGVANQLEPGVMGLYR